MEVKIVGVYGAGSMGRGIAQVALEGGYDVVLYNHRTPTLEKGVAGIKKNFDKKIVESFQKYLQEFGVFIMFGGRWYINASHTMEDVDRTLVAINKAMAKLKEHNFKFVMD